MSAKIKVLIVDDSSFMRLLIQDMLKAETDIEVVGTASDGKEAIEECAQLKPDVVLTDLTMKDYDGMYAIKGIMEQCPTPIIVVSSVGNTDPQKMIEALSYGAYDYLNKPDGAFSGKLRTVSIAMGQKIRAAAKVDLHTLKASHRKNMNEHSFSTAQNPYELLVLGASTGGTTALEVVLTNLPVNFPLPIIAVQHIPQRFLDMFVKRLNSLLNLNVLIAEEGMAVQPGCVYILQTEGNTRIEKRAGEVVFANTPEEFEEYNFPSISCLISSAAKIYKKSLIAAILTGMGRDGTNGIKDVKKQGGITIAQEGSTCVVNGMPKSAIESGAVDYVVKLDQIPGFIVSCF